MPVIPATEENVRRAAEILASGGVVAFPTETVYGLGANAALPEACAQIFEIKRRPHFDPLIVHVLGTDDLRPLCAALSERARALADAFWPGPLTLVLPKKSAVPDIVTAGLPTVAVRVPAHPVARALLEASRCAIAAPSANPFGYLSPTLAAHVERQIGDRVPLILDGGPTAMGLESTIVDCSREMPRILRPGAIEAERIEAVAGTLAAAGDPSTPEAPGQLPSHYAPRTRVVLLDRRATAGDASGTAGFLAFGALDPQVASAFARVENLSATSDLREAATRLFACLHRLDQAGLDAIVVERVPRIGVGVAIVDRLERAAFRSG